VQISGVTGEVVDIGLMQFQIQELDKPSKQPTGRVVSFSNSFVFVSPATGLFRGMQVRRSPRERVAFAWRMTIGCRWCLKCGVPTCDPIRLRFGRRVHSFHVRVRIGVYRTCTLASDCT
jgi:hypothetical protein